VASAGDNAPMYGNNPIRPPLSHDGSTLAVQTIFPTLQGEGPYAGVPSVFLRLGGCNLACTFCDTEFESFTEMPMEEIANEIKKIAADVIKLVVITGGEPLRQNIAPLCENLIAHGLIIQLETNGTLFRELPKEVEIICSPKNPTGQYYPIRPDLLPRITAFKFIISESNENYAYVPDVGQATYNTPVYVQPMDEYDDAKNDANYARASMLAESGGYMLSVQLHKILNIP